MSDQKIIFRRIHGHIVPIHVRAEGETEIHFKPDTTRKERATAVGKAAGLVGAGLGLAAYAGKKSSQLLDAAEGNIRVARAFAKSADLAADSMNLPKMIRGGKKSVQFAIRARQYSNAARYVKKVGIAGGAALIAGGIHKGLSATTIKDDEKTKLAIAAAGGVGANFALQSALLKASGLKLADALMGAARIVRRKKLGV